MFHRHILTFVLIGLAFGDLPTSKITPSLQGIYNTRTSSKVNIFVKMREGNENVLRSIKPLKFASRTEKINSIKTQLESLASTSQKGVLSTLESSKVNFTSFWINNQVFVRDAPLDLVQKLEQDPQVSSIREEMIYHIIDPIPSFQSSNTINDAEWNLRIIEAEEAWNLKGGSNGTGVVVGIIDSGVRYTHEALRSSYRQVYGWFDPFTGGALPIDENAHGTHVAGTIVGSHGIGVAPGAQWIACRGCETSSCDESALIRCGEWTTCPTLPDGSGADCTKAPHIVSNSWGGGQNSTTYLDVVNAWHAAGIIPVFAQGNAGPTCGSANSPGDLPNVIGVGSTDIFDTISATSSRGPALNGIVKPDITAPGSYINSASFEGDDKYVIGSGTSMATPHVSGVIALLKGVDPELTYERVKELIQENARRDLGLANTCGNTNYTQVPNNIYGYGRINARKSLQDLLGIPDEEDGGGSGGGVVFTCSLGKVVFNFSLLLLTKLLIL